MKKMLLIVVLVVVFSLLAGCGDSLRTWRVTKSTGLYDRADADAELLVALSVGTKVKDIFENDSFSQCASDEDIRICKVIVVETGREGWVIEKWLD